MGSSPDVGGSRGLGRPQTLDFNEQQQSAETLSARTQLGIAQNAVDVPLTNLGGNIWKYQNEPKRPLLAQNCNIFRAMVRSEETGEGQKSQQVYEELVNKLPLQLSLELKEEKKKPWEERDARMIVFDLILQFVAKARVWLITVAQINPNEASERDVLYKNYPVFQLNSWISTASEIRDEMRASLKRVKFQEQDKRDIKTNIQILNRLINLTKAIKLAKGKQRKKLVIKLNKELVSLRSEISREKIQGIMQATMQLIRTLRPIAEANRYKKGRATLIALANATDEMLRPGKGTHVFGEASIQLLQAFSEIPPKPTAAIRSFTRSFAAIMLLVFPTLSFAASGLRILKEKKDKRLKNIHIQSLGLRLSSLLIAESNFVPTALTCFFREIGMKEQEIPLSVSATNLFAMNVLIVNARAGNNEANSANPLLFGMKKVLIEELSKVKAEIKPNPKNRLVSSITTGLRQAIIGVKTSDAQGYFEAIHTILVPLKIRPDGLYNEGADITSLSLGLLQSWIDMQEHANFMSVISQAV